MKPYVASSIHLTDFSLFIWCPFFKLKTKILMIESFNIIGLINCAELLSGFLLTRKSVCYKVKTQRKHLFMIFDI